MHHSHHMQRGVEADGDARGLGQGDLAVVGAVNGHQQLIRDWHKLSLALVIGAKTINLTVSRFGTLDPSQERLARAYVHALARCRAKRGILMLRPILSPILRLKLIPKTQQRHESNNSGDDYAHRHFIHSNM